MTVLTSRLLKQIILRIVYKRCSAGYAIEQQTGAKAPQQSEEHKRMTEGPHHQNIFIKSIKARIIKTMPIKLKITPTKSAVLLFVLITVAGPVYAFGGLIQEQFL